MDEALALVRDAVDLLRVFVYQRAITTTTQFGLPGDVSSGRAVYLVAVDGHIVKTGWKAVGGWLGYTFSDQLRSEWEMDRFPEVANYIGHTAPPDGPARVLQAARLLSRAILETQPYVRMLFASIAIECLLGGSGKAYRLARRAVGLACGPNKAWGCEGDKPCTYFTTNSDEKEGYKFLKRLHRDPSDGPDAPCDVWMNFVLRYADRSAIAHGNPFKASPGWAHSDLSWAIKTLLLTAMPWLLDHPEDPFQKLDADLAAMTSEPQGSAEADSIPNPARNHPI